MKRAIPRLLVLSLILLAGLGFSSIMPAHAQGDFTVTNKVVVNGAVSSSLGIPNGGILKGQITATNLISGTDNSIFLSYTLNSTSPDLPIATFFPNPVPLSATVDSANTTMTITVNQNVLHGAYRLTVNATSGICPLTCFTHLLTYDIKVYSIGVTIDAQSVNPTDITPVLSASQAASFRVGVIVANATNAGGTNPKCTVAFPCSLSVFGWSFGLVYDPKVLVPVGDPNPQATPGNVGGLYVDSAQNTVLYGGQTNIGEGSSSWASIVAGQNAFAVTTIVPGKILVGLTLILPLRAAFLASGNGRFLLANVGFELLQQPSSPTPISVNPGDLYFSDDLGLGECTCVNSTITGQGWNATETITNAPPTASFTATPLPTSDSSCSTVYSIDAAGCSAYAFRFDASASSDPEAGPLTYVWDFGDGSRDSAAESVAGCIAPDADLNCAQGAVVIHDFEAVALLGGTTILPADVTVTLRVTDALGATGSARDLSGNPISNAQPSHKTSTVAADLNPTASFTFAPSSAGLGQTITFDASSSTDVDDTITSYTWNFGDSSPLLTTNPPTATTTHSYSAGGTYTITLRVNDTLGGSGTTTHAVVITDAPPSLTISPSAVPTAGQALTLTITASDSDGSIASVLIDWGDGTTPTTVTGNPSSQTHMYTNPGTYTITVTATDNGGNKVVKTSSVTVASSNLFAGPVLYAIIGVILGAIAASLLLVRRRGKNKAGPVATTK